jgi:transcriptional repressor NrdR
MKCPSCGHLENKVIDSRLSANGETTRRRRECEKCQRRYTTYERVEEVLPNIVKRDGRREPYDRNKLLKGLDRACEKRQVPRERLDALCDQIERDLVEAGDREIPSNVIGEWVMHHLREIDQVAYVRFASVYRRFDDIDEFLQELQQLTTRGRARKDAGPGGLPSEKMRVAPVATAPSTPPNGSGEERDR